MILVNHHDEDEDDEDDDDDDDDEDQDEDDEDDDCVREDPHKIKEEHCSNGNFSVICTSLVL